MAYTVKYEEQAVKDLQKISRPGQKRIIKKINWLAENLANIQPKPLTENLAGFFSLRVGDYRVIYEFDPNIRVIFIDRIGHRRDIYEQPL
jgi:mRNA interferase RelE/StbE